MDISEELTASLRSAVRRMVEGKDVAVAFSGGLDSGIVAAMTKEYAHSVKLYTAGVQDAYDVLESKEVAGILGWSGNTSRCPRMTWRRTSGR